MIRLFHFIFISLILSSCSLNEESKIWNKKNKKLDLEENVRIILTKEEEFSKEFNPKIKIDLSRIKFSNDIFNVQNNFGSSDYSGLFTKRDIFKFSKFKDIELINFKPLFLNNGLIFFDNSGSIIRYNNDQKVVWKKNFYSTGNRRYYQESE